MNTHSLRLGLAAILLDLGDTIMVETSQIAGDDGATLRANLVPQMSLVLHKLKSEGHRLALVADTRIGTYQNVLRQHGLCELFDVFAVSEEVGVEKPDPRIFRVAFDRLGIDWSQRSQVVMVGNNLQRDIRGANAVGLVSIWFHWNDRYPIQPSGPLEQPDFTVTSADELLKLISTWPSAGSR